MSVDILRHKQINSHILIRDRLKVYSVYTKSNEIY